tara:strand:- start:1479 stop:1703 length:225 start_codon:yes stop_codon:yes gene_type:complete
MIQAILAIISFIFGFFVKKQSSDLKATKKEVKLYEIQTELQKEINKRTIDNHLIDNDTAILQFKKNRDNYHSNK